MIARRWPALRFAAWAAAVHALLLAAWFAARSDAQAPMASATPEFTDVQVHVRSPDDAGDDDDKTPIVEPPEQVQARVELVARIRKAIAESPSGSWAGRYGASNGFSWCRVETAPDVGFVAWSADDAVQDPSSPFDEIVCGTVEERGGLLWLIPSGPRAAEKPFWGSPFVPVAWEERRYLVRRDGFLMFVCEVEREFERWSQGELHFLVGEGDGMEPVASGFDVPEAYRRAWKESLHARVVGTSAFGDRVYDAFRTTTITLDVGAAHGVMVGDRLWLDVYRTPSLSARVKSVAEHTCSALLRQPHDDSVVVHSGMTMSRLPNLTGRFGIAADPAERERAASLAYHERD